MLTVEVRPHRTHVLAHSAQAQKLFVMVRLSPVGEVAFGGVDTEVAVALAVDTSGSMYAHLPGGRTKIDRAVESIDSIGRLADPERNTSLAIIQFDTEASTVVPLTELDTRSARTISNEARRLRNFGGGTNLARGLTHVLDELGGARPSAIRKAVILTDGETTDEGECLKLADAFAEQGIPLICVGLGTDYNEDFLAELAARTNGFLYHLSESEISMSRFQAALQEALVRSKRELITDVRLALDPTPGAVLESVTRVYPMVQPLAPRDDRAWHLGNVSGDDEHVLVIALSLPDRPESRQAVLTVEVSYDVPTQGQHGVGIEDEVEVAYTSDPTEAASLNEDVIFFVQQARFSRQADHAVELTRQGRIAEAQRSLGTMQALSTKLGNPAMTSAVERAVAELASSATLMPDTAKSMKVGARTLTLPSPPTRQQGPITKQGI